MASRPVGDGSPRAVSETPSGVRRAHLEVSLRDSPRLPPEPNPWAFLLIALDVWMARLGLGYIRFTDEILVLAPTRWRLRHAVKVVNQELGALGLDTPPGKTFIRRIEQGV